MSRFSFINLLNEGDTFDDFHKDHKLETEHTSFKHRRIAESEIAKPRSKFTFADFLKSQSAEPAEEIDNTNYKEIDDLDDNEIDNTDYKEIDDLDDNEIDNTDYKEIDDLDDNEDELDNSNDADNAEVETKVEVLKPVKIGQEKSIQADLLNNYAKIDDLDKIKLNIKIVDPKTNVETELHTPNVLDKLDKPLNVKVIEPEEKPTQKVDIEIAKPEETSVEVKSSDDVTLETNDTAMNTDTSDDAEDTSEENNVEENNVEETSINKDETKNTLNVEETK